MVLHALGLILGLAALFFGGEWLVRGASRIAQSFGISKLVVGLTIVAMGTSAPELVVSVNAALVGSSDISVGNIVGSNIANIGLILGISGLVFPLVVHYSLLKKEMPIMLASSIGLYLTFLDGTIGRIEGLLLVIGMGIFLLFMFDSAKKSKSADDETESDVQPNRVRDSLLIVVGIAVLMVGANLTVDNAVAIALELGISELLIGITVVAVGTSLPELVTSVTAAFRRESDIAVGNIVGSNIFNILFIMGITAVIQPVSVAANIIRVDSLVMIAFAVLLLPMGWNRKLGRIEATLLLVAYVVYVIFAAMINA
jgi:cation:H+ antiporter